MSQPTLEEVLAFLMGDQSFGMTVKVVVVPVDPMFGGSMLGGRGLFASLLDEELDDLGDGSILGILSALFSLGMRQEDVDGILSSFMDLDIQHKATCPNCRKYEATWPHELQEAVMHFRMEMPESLAWFEERASAAAPASSP